ncbi:hypothetical protein POSPLADRAFT_1061422 [Postia placenta MAD-698-R-SB12]|uniref:Uncharacterized protein n=1 Tax=Postia placenta MAD-698-R-SB12 TaxID=670580 RepID=A0A1X6MMT6_9APHY|nr:hypothetical protein POSPLADRAFT_1061422 [Postia placenta MAD-698-R-SB12]OSX57741.1 hypothetical protein POSPLADRAFT_1061422 [Postia placenta MAD-698-R-SB12]
MTPLAPQREIRSPGASLFPRTVTLQRPPGRPCPMAPCPGLADGPMGHIRWLPSHDPLGMAVSRRALKDRLPTPLTDRRGISPGPRVARPWPVNHQGHSVKAAAAFALHAPRQAAAQEGRSTRLTSVDSFHAHGHEAIGHVLLAIGSPAPSLQARCCLAAAHSNALRSSYLASSLAALAIVRVQTSDFLTLDDLENTPGPAAPHSLWRARILAAGAAAASDATFWPTIYAAAGQTSRFVQSTQPRRRSPALPDLINTISPVSLPSPHTRSTHPAYSGNGLQHAYSGVHAVQHYSAGQRANKTADSAHREQWHSERRVANDTGLSDDARL